MKGGNLATLKPQTGRIIQSQEGLSGRSVKPGISLRDAMIPPGKNFLGYRNVKYLIKPIFSVLFGLRWVLINK